MRIIDKLKRFNTRRKALNELADVYLQEKYLRSVAPSPAYNVTTQLAPPQVPDPDQLLTEQQLQELTREVNTAAQVSTYDDIKREKLDVINRRLGV